jgi:DNA polymerase/3'-5' exonuclease PolX
MKMNSEKSIHYENQFNNNENELKSSSPNKNTNDIFKIFDNSFSFEDQKEKIKSKADDKNNNINNQTLINDEILSINNYVKPQQTSVFKDDSTYHQTFSETSEKNYDNNKKINNLRENKSTTKKSPSSQFNSDIIVTSDGRNHSSKKETNKINNKILNNITITSPSTITMYNKVTKSINHTSKISVKKLVNSNYNKDVIKKSIDNKFSKKHYLIHDKNNLNEQKRIKMDQQISSLELKNIIPTNDNDNGNRNNDVNKGKHEGIIQKQNNDIEKVLDDNKLIQNSSSSLPIQHIIDKNYVTNYLTKSYKKINIDHNPKLKTIDIDEYLKNKKARKRKIKQELKEEKKKKKKILKEKKKPQESISTTKKKITTPKLVPESLSILNINDNNESESNNNIMLLDSDKIDSFSNNVSLKENKTEETIVESEKTSSKLSASLSADLNNEYKNNLKVNTASLVTSLNPENKIISLNDEAGKTVSSLMLKKGGTPKLAAATISILSDKNEKEISNLPETSVFTSTVEKNMMTIIEPTKPKKLKNNLVTTNIMTPSTSIKQKNNEKSEIEWSTPKLLKSNNEPTLIFSDNEMNKSIINKNNNNGMNKENDAKDKLNENKKENNNNYNKMIYENKDDQIKSSNKMEYENKDEQINNSDMEYEKEKEHEDDEINLKKLNKESTIEVVNLNSIPSSPYISGYSLMKYQPEYCSNSNNCRLQNYNAIMKSNEKEKSENNKLKHIVAAATSSSSSSSIKTLLSPIVESSKKYPLKINTVSDIPIPITSHTNIKTLIISSNSSMFAPRSVPSNYSRQSSSTINSNKLKGKEINFKNENKLLKENGLDQIIEEKNSIEKDSLEKDSLEKNSLEKNSLEKNSLEKNSLEKNSLEKINELKKSIKTFEKREREREKEINLKEKENNTKLEVKQEKAIANEEKKNKRNFKRKEREREGTTTTTERKSKNILSNQISNKNKKNKKLFSSIVALIIPSKISRIRMKLMRNKIEKLGGTIVEKYSDNITHIIADLTFEEIINFLKLKSIKKEIYIVKPEWVSQSLKNGRLENEEIYKIWSKVELETVKVKYFNHKDKMNNNDWINKTEEDDEDSQNREFERKKEEARLKYEQLILHIKSDPNSQSPNLVPASTSMSPSQSPISSLSQSPSSYPNSITPNSATISVATTPTVLIPTSPVPDSTSTATVINEAYLSSTVSNENHKIVTNLNIHNNKDNNNSNNGNNNNNDNENNDNDNNDIDNNNDYNNDYNNDNDNDKYLQSDETVIIPSEDEKEINATEPKEILNFNYKEDIQENDLLKEEKQDLMSSPKPILENPLYTESLIASSTLEPSSEMNHESELNHNDILASSDIKPYPNIYKPRKVINQDSYLCMKKNSKTIKTDGPNENIIKVLTELLNYYQLIKSEWRIVSYQKAISAIRRYPNKISSYKQAKSIFGIGDGIAKKIEEIINTGSCKKLQSFRKDKMNEVLKMFIQIWGVGESTAQKWYGKGYRTIEDILKHEHLSYQQKVGIQLYNEFKERMPREEAEEISNKVQSIIKTQYDPDLKFFTMGSFRRGLPTCGDIDIIITKNDNLDPELLYDVVKILKENGILTHDLSFSKKSSEEHSKYMGVAQLPGHKHRRIDLLIVPWNELGAALLYFTGSDIFNRSLRLLARKKGWRLNQRGLYANVLRNSDSSKITTGVLIASKTEKDIFDALEVPYREPKDRDA